jgi:glutamate mutase epsilon subunit
MKRFRCSSALEGKRTARNRYNTYQENFRKQIHEEYNARMEAEFRTTIGYESALTELKGFEETFVKALGDTCKEKEGFLSIMTNALEESKARDVI